jgi:peptidylprolyl isomerase
MNSRQCTLRLLALVAGLALVATLTAACGDGDEEASPTPAASATPLPPGTPVTGGPPAVSGETITTASGLKYIDIEVGSGAAPQTGQTVVLTYTGWLAADGTKFDASVDHGQPLSFAIGTGKVIKGWDEGVATMKVGGKRRLIIPPDLAYGENGYPGVIPANAELIFDVDLLEIR